MSVRAAGCTNTERVHHLPNPLAESVAPVCHVDQPQWIAKPAEWFPPAHRDWYQYCAVGVRHADRSPRQAIRAVDPRSLVWAQ